MKGWKILLTIYIFAFSIYVYFFGTEVQPADWMQIMLLTALVGVTVFYAWATHRQAESSAKTVESMREQTIMASRPVIIQKAINKSDLTKKYVKLDGQSIPKSKYHSHFLVMNVGHGPAVELEVSLTNGNKDTLESKRITYLKQEDTFEFEHSSLSQRGESNYYLVCEYKLAFPVDTDPKWQQTWLPFEISKASKEGEIYVISGELEFQEVTDKNRIAAFGRNKPA